MTISESKPGSALQRVFDEASSRGRVSVSALARTLRLKGSTVEAKVRALERKGLLTGEAGVAGTRRSPRRGSHGVLNWVRVNPGFGYLVGIDMGASHLHFALADFCGEILAESDVKIRPEDGPRKMIGQIKSEIRKIVAHKVEGDASRRPAGKKLLLQGLAIGVPSPVDPVTSLVSFANNLPGWSNIDLRGELEKDFGVPVAVENDANTAAIGEHWRGVARGVNDFVFIALGTGIGSGIFANGSLVRGRTGAAGELYRLNLEWQRWDEDFGDTGYYESHVSGLGIAAEGRKQLDGSASDPKANSAPALAAVGLAKERDAYFVFDAFRRDDPKARAVLEKIFTMLGVGVANLVAVLDPSLIVLGGGITKGAPEFMLSVVEKVANRIQPGGPPIKLSSLEDKAQTYGAIFSALTLAREKVRNRL